MVTNDDKPPEKPPSSWQATANRLRRIKRRWQMLRFGVRVLVVLLLLLAGGIIFLLFYPLSLPWLDERIKKNWDESVGLPLDYQRSTIRLARAQVTFEQPILKDPETGELLMSLRRVEANGSLVQLLFGRGPRTIESLRLEGPTVIRVATRGKHMEVMAPWPRVAEVLEKRMKKKSVGGKPRVAIKQLTVEPVDLRWIDQTDSDARARLAFEGLALTVDFGEGSRPRQLMLAGKYAEGPSPARDFLLMARPDPDYMGTDLLLRLEGFFSRDVRAKMPIRFNTGQILVSAHVRKEKDSRWNSNGSVRVNEAYILGPAPTSTGMIQAEWSGSFDPAAERVTVGNLTIIRPRTSLAARCWFDTREPRAYELILERLDTDGDELFTIVSRLFPVRGLVVEGKPKITAFGVVASDSITTTPHRLEANAQFSGIDLAEASMISPTRRVAPLHAISGRLTMTTHTLLVQKLAFRYGGLPVQVDGIATGTLPRSVEGLSLAWRTLGSSIPSGDPAIEPTVTGDLDGSGTLRLEEPTRTGIITSLARARLNGAMRFSDVTLTDPWLPLPLSAINGRIELEPSEARIEKFEGRLGSTALACNAVVTGRELLWTSPTLTLDTRLSGELRDIAEQIKFVSKSAGHEIKPLPPVSGSAALEVRARELPLAALRSKPVQATLKLQDFATTLVLGRIKGPIVVRGDFEGRATLRPATRQGFPADVSAQLTMKKGVVRNPKLPPVSDVVGRIAWSDGSARFENFGGEALGGRVMLNGTLSGNPGPWSKPSADMRVQIETSLANAMTQARRRGFDTRPLGFTDWRGDAVLKLSVAGPLLDWRKLDASGRIDIRDFETSFTVKRVNGPVRIPRLAIALDGQQLRLEPLTGRYGDLDLTAEGAFRPWGGVINASVDGELAEMKRRVPPGLEFFSVGGAGRIEHHQKLLTRPGFPPPARWADLIDYYLKLRETSGGIRQVKNDWRWDFDGSLNLRDAELTHWRMPTPLAGITGLAYYNDGRLWSAGPLPVRPGVNSRDVRSTIEVTWTDGAREGTLNFGVSGEHFSLDEWLKPWGRGKRPPNRPDRGPPPDLPFDPNLKPFFSIRGTFKTRSGDYNGVECRNIDGILSIDNFRGRPNMLRYYLSQASVYDGKADLSGTLYSRRLNAVFETRDVQLRPLIEALTKQQKPGGVFSGSVTGRIEIKKDFRLPRELNGQGEVHLKGSRLVSNAILHSLGGLLKLPLLEDISFSSIHGPITIENRRISSSALVFDNPIINLKASGSVGFDRTLDMQIQAQVFQIASNVPLVGIAVDVINQLVGKVIRVQVKGTTEDPQITPL